MKLPKKIYVKDELGLYLVAKRLKPATSFGIKNCTKKIKAQFKILFEKEGLYFKEYDTGFQVATTKENLKRVIRARSIRDSGLAFGYPLSAIRAIVKSRRKLGEPLQKMDAALEKAAKARVKAPLWYAYLLHVPEYLDLIKNKVPKSTLNLGKKYKRYVRRYNPDLARRVEADFIKYYTSKI